MKNLNQLLLFWSISILFVVLLTACGSSAPDATIDSEIEPALEAYPDPESNLLAESRSLDESYPAPDSSTGDAVITSVVVEQVEPEGESDMAESDTMTVGSGDADVLFVEATLTGENLWRFNVTVEHPDTGWEDYADGWDVVTPDGTVLKVKADDPFTRLLLHPHETEQPFTRSQSNVPVPASVTLVTVRAHDLVDGFGGQEVVVDLSQSDGLNFTVSR